MEELIKALDNSLKLDNCFIEENNIILDIKNYNKFSKQKTSL